MGPSTWPGSLHPSSGPPAPGRPGSAPRPIPQLNGGRIFYEVIGISLVQLNYRVCVETSGLNFEHRVAASLTRGFGESQHPQF